MRASELQQTRLASFERHDASISPGEPGSAIGALLDGDAGLPGVIVVDDGGLVLGVVSRATYLDVMGRPFGRSLFARRPISLLLDAIDEPPLMLASTTPVAVAAQRALDRPHGSVEPVVVVDPDGTVGLVDVVELLRAQNAEVRAAFEDALLQRDAARDADRAKCDFLATVSHEIRTPLTAILGFADLLQDRGGADEEGVEALDAIRRNGRHLLTLINDVLDFSKIQSGHVEVESVDVDVLELLDDAVGMVRRGAEDKGLEVVVEHSLPLPRRISSDPLRLRQILVNLLGNAVKFTARGQVSVHVSMSRTSGGDELIVEVADTGIGMSAAQVERVFDAFVQADVSTTRTSGGTGLGLAISRDLARVLGGDIVASSREGYGSVFRLSVPAGRVPDADLVTDVAALEVRERDAHDAAEHGVAPLVGRVLVVEDTPVNQRLVALMLRRFGLDVDVAGDGREALERLADGGADDFDAVLMDVRMPQMSGPEATAALRERGVTVPIIALTAQTGDENRATCLRAGCDDFVPKPIDRAELEAALRRALSVRHGAR